VVFIVSAVTSTRRVALASGAGQVGAGEVSAGEVSADTETGKAAKAASASNAAAVDLAHDPEKLADFSDKIMRESKEMQSNIASV
jgi:hypothetical protein